MKGLDARPNSYTKFNPRTQARAIRRVGAETNPPKIKQMGRADEGHTLVLALAMLPIIISVMKKFDFSEDGVSSRGNCLLMVSAYLG